MAIASELSEVHPAEDRFLEGVPGSTFGGPRLAINFAADLNVVVIGAVPASHTDGRDCAASTRHTNTVLLGATGRRPRAELCMLAAAVTSEASAAMKAVRRGKRGAGVAILQRCAGKLSRDL